MDDKLKWVLLAAGGYFLYDWWSKNRGAATAGGVRTGPGTLTIAPAPGPLAVPADQPQTPAQPAVTNISLLATMNNDQVAVFAAQGNQDAVAVANNRGLRYTHHQWNWFRSQALGEQPDPELWAAGHSNEAVSADVYLAMRAAAGMSGLGWAPVLPWSTAWQA